jgi:hypothetical protein
MALENNSTSEIDMPLFLFCVETRQPAHDDKLTLKKVIDLVNKHEDQNLKEMNRKLQNMLEETLTKNMHLQEVSVYSDTRSGEEHALLSGMLLKGLKKIEVFWN